MTDNHGLVAFLACLLAIVFMAWLKVDQSVMFGLVGVIGTFKPRSNGVSDETAKTLTDKIPPTTGETQDGRP